MVPARRRRLTPAARPAQLEGVVSEQEAAAAAMRGQIHEGAAAELRLQKQNGELREALEETQDPTAQQLAYHKRLHKELRPYYLTQRAQDRSAIKRAEQALTPDYQKSWRARMIEGFFDDGVRIALRSDTGLLRQAMRGFHMLEHPNKWLGKPGNFAKVLWYWSRGKKANAAAYPPSAGPERSEMMQLLALNHTADIDRLASQRKMAA